MIKDNNKSTLTRRSFSAAAAAVGTLMLTGCQTHVTSSQGLPSAAYPLDASEDIFTTSDQFGFLVIPKRCLGCGACVSACRTFNHLTSETKDRRIITTITQSSGAPLHVSTACMHCEHPSCVAACPTGAISKGAGGAVTIDQSECIGCRYCRQACPYNVPTYNSNGMDKCDLCLGADLPLGDQVACAQACPTQALYYGTLEQLVETAKAIRVDAQPIALENNPSCLIA